MKRRRRKKRTMQPRTHRVENLTQRGWDGVPKTSKTPIRMQTGEIDVYGKRNERLNVRYFSLVACGHMGSIDENVAKNTLNTTDRGRGMERPWHGCSLMCPMPWDEPATTICGMFGACRVASWCVFRCSILGITAQALMEQCGLAAYEAEVSWLRERCLQLNRDTSVRPSVPRRDSEPTEDYTSRDGRIRYEPEFRFMLTRHWTLFSSMLHSRYMATRLAVWRDKGRRLLETFIVKMGIPLAQCKLDYSSMDLELKESLPLRISKHAAEFGLNDVSMPSFVRDFGFVMRMSASDAVYALMALIEAPYAAMDLTASAVASERTSTETIWVSNFYYALDALDTYPSPPSGLCRDDVPLDGWIDTI